tara:strand:+ start:4752 stop:5324 length:573 start_codon:yes stop_codon:yes gene_type:complete
MINFSYIENKMPDIGLYDLMTDKNFDWYYNDNTLGSNFESSISNIEDSSQFVHVFFNKYRNVNQDAYAEKTMMLLPYIENNLGVKIKGINRIKGNMLLNKTNWSAEKYHPPHYDEETNNFMSVLYYVNDSDGDTLIFDKNYPSEPKDMKILARYQPKKGACAIFNSTIYHASCNPINSNKRIVINYILEI